MKFLLSEDYENLYITNHSSMSQALHKCSVCEKPIPHGVKAIIHHFVERNFVHPNSLFVAHWDTCAKEVGLNGN